MTKPEEIKRLRKNQELSYTSIAEKLDIPESTVAYYCRKLDENDEIIKRNRKSSTKGKIGTDHLGLSEEQERKIKALTKYGLSTNDIEKLIDVDLEAIKEFVYKSDFKRRFLDSDSTPYEQVEFRRNKNMLMAILYKGGECQECGYDRNKNSLEFHHTDPSQKDVTISDARSYSFETMKKELKKCVLLCVRCHSERHDTDDERNRIISSFDW